MVVLPGRADKWLGVSAAALGTILGVYLALLVSPPGHRELAHAARWSTRGTAGTGLICARCRLDLRC